MRAVAKEGSFVRWCIMDMKCGNKTRTLPALFFLEGGKILLMDRLGSVFRYDLQTHSSDNIWRSDKDDNKWSVPIPNMNSFVSFKALGEKNVETFTEDDD